MKRSRKNISHADWGLVYQINDKGVGVMNIKITGRNIELTEGLKVAVEDKLNKLEKSVAEALVKITADQKAVMDAITVA